LCLVAIILLDVHVGIYNTNMKEWIIRIIYIKQELCKKGIIPNSKQSDVVIA